MMNSKCLTYLNQTNMDSTISSAIRRMVELFNLSINLLLDSPSVSRERNSVTNLGTFPPIIMLSESHPLIAAIILTPC